MKQNQMSITPALLKRAAQVWREAGNKLGCKVTAPFKLVFGDQSVDCMAFLPHFGGAHGAVIAPMMPPSFHTDTLIRDLAQKHGYHLTFMNAVGWETYDEEAFKDVLIDLGFFGPANECPAWLVESQQK